jgi:hypothetical protein
LEQASEFRGTNEIFGDLYEVCPSVAHRRTEAAVNTDGQKLGYGLIVSPEVAQYDLCFFVNKIKTAKMLFPGMSLKLETIADRLDRIPKCQF